MIDIAVEKQLSTFRLDAQFKVAASGITAVLGRSGAGKSSILQAIAGGLRPDRGHIAIGDRVLFDSADGVDMPIHQRRIGYVFQDGRLFPHLNVRDNLLFGFHRAKKQERPERLFALDPIVDLLGLHRLLDRRPHALSGGEKQRVAIGRALLSQPSLLLYDEPLAALDPERKAELLPYIERVSSVLAVPALYVSHALDEVARIAGHVVMIENGRITAEGPAAALLQDLTAGRPALTARIVSHDPGAGITVLNVAGQTLTVPLLRGAIGSAVRLAIDASGTS